MNTHSDKIRKDHDLRNSTNDQESITASPIHDSRPVAVAQRKLQQLADSSPQVMQQKAWQHSMQTTQLKKEDTQKENKTGLPDELKSGIENLSGYSLDGVKVHYNSGKPAQMQAHAFAQGSDIHIASGQEKHLPHEAWHVVQQKQGRVKPVLQTSGVNVNNEASLEAEADAMGAKSLSTVQKVTADSPYCAPCNSSTVQMNGTEQDDAKQLTWREWFWKHRWKFITGIVIGALTIGAVYLLYKKYGGVETLPKEPVSEPVPLTGGSGTSLETPGTDLQTGTHTGTPSVETPTPSLETSTPSVDTTPSLENNTPTVETSTPSPSMEDTTKHAWPPGKPYTGMEKVKSVVSMVPGGGLVVEGLEQIVTGKPDGTALVAEIVKLHPYAWPANVYDNVAKVLSYYSEGKIEIGQTKDLVEMILKNPPNPDFNIDEMIH